MKTIMLEVDDRAGNDYQSLSAPGKRTFNAEVVRIIRDKAKEERTAKITKILAEIRNEELDDVQRDILVQILSLEALEG